MPFSSNALAAFQRQYDRLNNKDDLSRGQQRRMDVLGDRLSQQTTAPSIPVPPQGGPLNNGQIAPTSPLIKGNQGMGYAPDTFAPQPQTLPFPPGFSGLGAPPPLGGMRPMQPLDTSEQAYKTFMASAKFAPGSTPPTYEQWSQSMQNRPQIPSMADPRIQQPIGVTGSGMIRPPADLGFGALPPMMTNYGPGTTGGIESSPLSAYAQQLAQGQGVFGQPPALGMPTPSQPPQAVTGGYANRMQQAHDLRNMNIVKPMSAPVPQQQTAQQTQTQPAGISSLGNKPQGGGGLF